MAARKSTAKGQHEEEEALILIRAQESAIPKQSPIFSDGKSYPKGFLTFFYTSSILCGISGIYAGEYFMTARYDLRHTYNAKHFWALVCQTFLLPASSVLMILFALHSFKSNCFDRKQKIIFYCLGILASLIMARMFVEYSTDGLIGCLVWFCIWRGDKDPKNEAGLRNTQTLIYVIMTLAFTAMFLYLLCRLVMDPKIDRSQISFLKKNDANPEHEANQVKKVRFSTKDGMNLRATAIEAPEIRRQRRIQDQRWNTAMLFLGFIVFYPMVILLCLSLPDSFTKFTVRRIQHYASSEIPSTRGKVWNFQPCAGLVLHLYPDILFFYLFIYGVALMGILIQHVPVLQRFFHSAPRCLRGLTVGDIVLATAFSVLLFAEFCYWYFTHGWEYHPVSSVSRTERFARAIGQVASACCGLLVLPVARNSLWTHVFGASWEAMIKFHRWAGVVMLVVVVAHTISWFAFYSMNNLNFWAIPQDYHKDNFTIHLAFIATLLILISMGILSHETFRRNHFELFYYTHHIFLVVFGVMLYHATSAWYYMLGGLSLYMLDRAIRFVRGTTLTRCIDAKVVGGVIKLSYQILSQPSLLGRAGPRPRRHKMGQYYFINIPAVSTLEWHPFTVSSAPSNEDVTHHIKNMGPDSFTDKLEKLVNHLEWNGKTKNLLINIDGPYGMHPDLETYQQIVFIAGGIGITPISAFIREFFARSKETELGCIKRIDLIWVAKDRAQFNILSDILRDMSEHNPGGMFTCKLFATQSTVEEGSGEGGFFPSHSRNFVLVEGRRPDLKVEVTRLQGLSCASSSSILFSCGPPSLVQESKIIATELDFCFFQETFLL